MSSHGTHSGEGNNMHNSIGAREHQDMLDLRAQTQTWIDSLIIAGMSENAAAVAIHMAVVERALIAGGVPATASWLRGMAKHVETQGPALLAELRAQGH